MHQRELLLETPEVQKKRCHYCKSDLLMAEGIWLYDKKWFHDGCLDAFEKRVA